MVRKKKKTSSEQQFCGQKHVVNERGQRRRARLVEADRKVTVTQITTHYNSGMQKSISEHTLQVLKTRLSLSEGIGWEFTLEPTVQRTKNQQANPVIFGTLRSRARLRAAFPWDDSCSGEQREDGREV